MLGDFETSVFWVFFKLPILRFGGCWGVFFDFAGCFTHLQQRSYTTSRCFLLIRRLVPLNPLFLALLPFRLTPLLLGGLVARRATLQHAPLVPGHHAQLATILESILRSSRLEFFLGLFLTTADAHCKQKSSIFVIQF